MKAINIHNPLIDQGHIIDKIRKQSRMVQKLQHALYVSISMLCILENSLADEDKDHAS